MQKNPAIESLYIEFITIPDRHRPVDMEAVKTLAASMDKIGLRTPITIRSPNESECYLVAGRHRLEAAKQLGWEKIDCFIVDCSEDDAEMWEISENLHRAELSVIQRAEQIGRWVELAAKVAQLGPRSNAQPKEAGIRKAATDLNINRQDVQRAVKIATLTPEAKQAAVTRGLDDNQSALLAAAVVSPERQVEAIHNFADSKLRAAIERANPPEFKEWSEMEAKQYRALVTAWNNASPRVREKFEEDRDIPVMDRRAS